MASRFTRRSILAMLATAPAAHVAADLLKFPIVPAHAAEAIGTDPVTRLPDWLEGQPDWLLANVERYAAALAALNDPHGAFIGTRTNAGAVLFWAENMVRGMNVTDEEDEAPRRQRAEAWKQQEARTPREVGQDRIVTVQMPKLDRNERRRLRRWLAALPTGATDPRVVYRLGWRDRVHGERDYDYLSVVAPVRQSIMEPSPHDRAERITAEMLGAVGLQRRATAPVFAYLCAHQSPAVAAARAYLYEWPDGTVSATLARTGTA